MPHSSSRCLGFKLCSSPEVRFRGPLKVPKSTHSNSIVLQCSNPVKVRKKVPYAHRCAEVRKKNPMLTGSLFLKTSSKEPYARFHFCKVTHIPRRDIFIGKPHFHYTICSQRPDWYILSPVGCSPSMVTIDLKRTLYSGCQN